MRWWCWTKRRRCRSRCSSSCGCCSISRPTTEKLLRIVLVGQPQLRKLLLDPDLAQLNQRITLRWHIGPLSRRETMAYVHHRLAVASGGRAMRLFTRPALRLVHSCRAACRGSSTCSRHRALLAAFVAREPRVTRRFVARAYREIQAVPLPGTLTLARRAALAGSGLAIGAALVAFGMPVYDRLVDRFVPPPAEVASAPALPVAAVPAPPAVEPSPIPSLAASSPAPADPEPMSVDGFAERLAPHRPGCERPLRRRGRTGGMERAPAGRGGGKAPGRSGDRVLAARAAGAAAHRQPQHAATARPAGAAGGASPGRARRSAGWPSAGSTSPAPR